MSLAPEPDPAAAFGSAAAGGAAAGAGADSVLLGLDPEQRAVATTLDGPLCVIAGAGTGKTRAVTHRIAYGVRSGVMNPSQVLALTFTAKAAGELRSRLRALDVGGVQARTFHSAALRQLRYFWPRAVGGELPELVGSKARLVARAAGRRRLTLPPAAVRDLAAEIEWAKVSQVVPDSYAAAAAARSSPAGLTHVEVGQLYAAYEEVKRGDGAIDFEDVLLLTVGILEDRADVAEQVRATYRHLTVDEYQDVNPLQQRLLDLWLGDRESLCVVGDPRQTIYSFTGATPRFLLDFRRRFPSAQEVRLVRSYRSTPQVVALANRVAAAPGGERGAAAADLVAQREPGPEPMLSEHPDETAEAVAVAARIKTLVAAGVPLREIAVLYRINAQSEAYEQALADAGLPYLVRGGERFFERPEIRQALLLIRGAARGGLTDEGGEPGSATDTVRAVLAGLGLTAEPPTAMGKQRDLWESLNSLVRLTAEIEARGGDLQAVVVELDDRAAAAHAPAVDGVSLASMHAAKGLEWDAVFVVGLVDGTLPIVHADTPAQVDEERRLLYVAVTRARVHLELSWALARSPGGRASRRPSRFLDGLVPRGTGPARDTGRGGGRASRRGPRTCRVCGRVLTVTAERRLGRCEGCVPDYDEALLERLRAWRLEESRRQSVPAYVVFTDSTLIALAESMPTDDTGLLAVPGLGRAKLDRYGPAVLALLAGDEPPAVLDPSD